MQQLYHDLQNKYGATYLLTYRLNQDVLENFFGVIRSKGGLFDHPDPLNFLYRTRAYILGRNEGSVSYHGNTMIDDTPDLDSVSSLSSRFFKNLVANDKKCINNFDDECVDKQSVECNERVEGDQSDERNKRGEGGQSDERVDDEKPDERVDIDKKSNPDENDELESLQFDGLEHLGGYICYRLKMPAELEAPLFENDWSWTNQLTEGGLKKPSFEMLTKLEKLENIFKTFNKESIVCKKGYIKSLLQLSKHIELTEKAKQIFFRSRMFFRIRILNKNLADFKLSKKRKMTKIVS